MFIPCTVRADSEIRDSDRRQFLYQAVNLFICSVQTDFFGLVCVVFGTSRASLKQILNKHQILALPHCLSFSNRRLLLGNFPHFLKWPTPLVVIMSLAKSPTLAELISLQPEQLHTPPLIPLYEEGGMCSLGYFESFVFPPLCVYSSSSLIFESSPVFQEVVLSIHSKADEFWLK